MQTAELFPICKVRGADGSVTTINLFTLSLLSKKLWLSVIKALNTLKLFSHRSQDLQSRPGSAGFNSFRGNDQMSRRSSIHSLGRSVFVEEIFTICNVLNGTTQPTTTLSHDGRGFAGISRIRASYRSWFILVTTTSRTPVG